MIAQSGLERGAPLVEGCQRLRQWLRLAPGEVYQHLEWGEGVVREVDPATGTIILDFPAHPGRKMTVKGVQRFLKYLDPAHFLARKAREPQTLARLAEDDPAALIREALAGAEGKSLKQGELKAQLTSGIIE